MIADSICRGCSAELVQLKVDVIVVPPLVAIRAAKQATKMIPIVMVTTTDPVATGLIDSLACPGGSITRLTRLTAELSGKTAGVAKGGGYGAIARRRPLGCGRCRVGEFF